MFLIRFNPVVRWGYFYHWVNELAILNVDIWPNCSCPCTWWEVWETSRDKTRGTVRTSQQAAGQAEEEGDPGVRIQYIQGLLPGTRGDHQEELQRGLSTVPIWLKSDCYTRIYTSVAILVSGSKDLILIRLITERLDTYFGWLLEMPKTLSTLKAESKFWLNSLQWHFSNSRVHGMTGTIFKHEHDVKYLQITPT